MRAIKFRAWVDSIVPEETGLYYPLTLMVDEQGGVFKFWTNDYKFTPDTCEFTLMQYTGLADFYEGDILAGDGLIGAIAYGDFVEDHGDFMYRSHGFYIGDHSLGYWHATENLRVIGNIYENPELIKKETT